MEKLDIAGHEFTPTILFQESDFTLTISGVSVPEDTKGFYEPVFKWLENLVNTGFPNKFILAIKLQYFNTSSSKIVYDLIAKLEKCMAPGRDIKVHWCYASDDEDMLESGQNFSEIVSVPFEFVSYQ
jgi:Zn-dependent M16 (insulinase) family peptidase